MKRKVFVSIISLGALAVALAFGAVAYHSAKAATLAQTTTTGNTGVVNSPAPMGLREGVRGGPGGVYTSEELAAALGISAADLTTAYTKANDAGLAQAVTQGLITQAQADEIKNSGSAFPFGGRWDGFLSKNGVDYDALLAEALGITVDKLQAAYITAYNAHVDAEVTAGTLTQDQAELMKGQYALQNDKSFQSSMQTAYQAAVAQAVKDVVITQAQADLILKNASSQLFKGPGFFGGPGGHGRGGPHGQNGTDTTASPTATTTP